MGAHNLYAMAVRNRYAVVFFSFVALWASSCTEPVQRPPVAEGGVLDLSGWHFEADGPVRMTGEWEFYWRELLAPADFPRSKAAREPLYYKTPAPWNGLKVNGRELGGRGYATLRLRLRAPPNETYAIYLGATATSHAVFVNGERIFKNGAVGRTPDETRPQFLPVDGRLPRAGAAGEYEFIVQIANFAHRRGGMWAPIHIGTEEQIEERFARGLFRDVMLASSMLMIGLYHLAFFYIRRVSKEALLFGLFCLLVALRAMVTGERFLLQTYPELPFELLLKTEYLTFFGATALFVLYVQSIFPDEFSRWVGRIVRVAAIVFCAFVLVTPLEIYSYSAPVYQLLSLGFLAHVSFAAIQALRHAREGAVIYLTGTGVFLFTYVNDLLYYQFLSPYANLSALGSFVFVFAQALLLARRYSTAFGQVEKLSGELEIQNRELLRLDKIKDAFLANTSHELRTPLLGIIGMADALRDDEGQDLGSGSQRRLELIAASGRRLSRLVGDILDFSKLRHRDVSLRPTAVRLRPLVQVQIELFAFSAARSANVQMINAVPADLPPVRADEERLTQVLQNLLGNAQKFTTAGEIRVSARRADDTTIEIEVADSGAGIPLEDRARIFEPFEQAEGTTGGTGLGLSIARSLVELQGGRLWLSAQERPGTTLCMTLPIATAEETTSAPATPSPIQANVDRTLVSIDTAAPGIAADRPPPGGGRTTSRVLIVDDEPVNREVMQSYLEASDTRVELAANADEVRARLQNDDPPDCLVLDIMMPGTSGLELARELRREYARTDLPILMVTARTQTADLLAAIEAGANDYLTKPFEKKEFLHRVGNLIELARTHRDVQAGRVALRDAAKRERARINSDLHDHLGASLTDLKLFSETARENPEVDGDFARKLEDKVESAVRLLRNDLLDLEDLSLLEENFMAGIQMIILRRYVEAGRSMDFRAPESGRQELNRQLQGGLVAVLYAVIKEMVTNDLKYGSGDSVWQFDWDASELRIDFASRSHYHLARHGTGKGTAGMIRRLTEVGGDLQLKLEEAAASESDPALEIHIALPLN